MPLLNDNNDKDDGYCDRKAGISERRAVFRQSLVAVASFAEVLCGGFLVGFTGIFLPQLEHTLELTAAQVSWIASSPMLMIAFTTLLSGYLMDRYGRKLTLSVAALFTMLGWFTIAHHSTYEELLIGRMLCGCAGGFGTTTIGVFNSEVAAPKYRTLFVNIALLGRICGPLLCHIIGYITSLYYTSIAAAFIPVVILLLLANWIEDSPVYNHSTFYYYRTQNERNKLELEAIKLKQLRKTKFTLNLRFVRAYFICFLVVLSEITTGNKSIAFYSMQMLEIIAPNINSFTSMIIVDSVRLVASLIACVLFKKFQARKLALFSGYATACTLILLAIIIRLDYDLSILALILLLLATLFTIAGLAPLPWIVAGELFNDQTRGVGAGLTMCTFFACFFVLIKQTPTFLANLGYDGTFALFGGGTLICIVLLQRFLPETHHKTLNEIDDEMR